MSKYLPDSLKKRVPTRPEDVLILNYKKGVMYCIDHVFRENGLPHFNTEGELVEEPETISAISNRV